MTRLCTWCGGTGWRADEAWSSPDPFAPVDRAPGDGLIQCGGCFGSGAHIQTTHEILDVLRLHRAWEALPADRGGRNGAKAKAYAAFIAARDQALAEDEEGT